MWQVENDWIFLSLWLQAQLGLCLAAAEGEGAPQTLLWPVEKVEQALSILLLWPSPAGPGLPSLGRARMAEARGSAASVWGWGRMGNISGLPGVREESSTLGMGLGYGAHSCLSSSCWADSVGGFGKGWFSLTLIEIDPNIPKIFLPKVSKDTLIISKHTVSSYHMLGFVLGPKK